MVSPKTYDAGLAGPCTRQGYRVDGWGRHHPKQWLLSFWLPAFQDPGGSEHGKRFFATRAEAIAFQRRIERSATGWRCLEPEGPLDRKRRIADIIRWETKRRAAVARRTDPRCWERADA